MSLKVHNTHKRISITPTITAGAYSANDVVGGLLTIPCGPGTLRKTKLVDKDSEGAELYLFLFHTIPTLPVSDNGAFAATGPNALNMLESRIHFDDDNYVTIASTDDYCFGIMPGDAMKNQSLAIECAPADGLNMYGYLVCVGTPTYAAVDDLLLELLFWSDRAG